MELHIKRLETLEELYETYSLVAHLTPELDPSKFQLIQQEMCRDGYQCIGAYGTDLQLLGMCGYWIRHRFYCGKSLYIDNIVSSSGIRGRGIGTVLMEWVLKEAEAQACEHIALDAYIDNKESHAFYLTHGFSIAGVHFWQKLQK